MKWSPRDAISQHAAAVLADPKSREEDCVSARRAISNPTSAEALDALSDEDLDALKTKIEASLAELNGPRHCIVCGTACAACVSRES